jgi:electron transport complex protein RnfB
MIAAIISLTILGLTIGFSLGFAAKRFKVEKDPRVDEVEAMMPASNCGQCGYPGCGPAAEAVVKGEALVTLCPPGGRALAEALAAKLGVDADLSGMEDKGPQLAFVREATCVGCTRCFKACPTDAIVGAPKMIHTVIASACTGCNACVDACPTECLEMREIPETLSTWRWPKPGSQPVPAAA